MDKAKFKESSKTGVLIVDDEQDICFFLKYHIRKRNMWAATAGSRSEARRLIAETHPAIVFLDNHLPDGYGVDIVRDLKLASPDTYVVMISAHDSDEDRSKAKNEGVDFFLSKPFTILQVNHVLDDILPVIGH